MLTTKQQIYAIKKKHFQLNTNDLNLKYKLNAKTMKLTKPTANVCRKPNIIHIHSYCFIVKQRIHAFFLTL